MKVLVLKIQSHKCCFGQRHCKQVLTLSWRAFATRAQHILSFAIVIMYGCVIILLLRNCRYKRWSIKAQIANPRQLPTEQSR